MKDPPYHSKSNQADTNHAAPPKSRPMVSKGIYVHDKLATRSNLILFDSVLCTGHALAA